MCLLDFFIQKMGLNTLFKVSLLTIYTKVFSMMGEKFLDPEEPNLMGKSHESLKRVIHRKAKICSCDR